MPFFNNADVSIHYTVTSPDAGASDTALPLLLIAPGGMRSAIGFWDDTPWDPRAQLGAGRRVIAMDQRNAGESRAPVRADDGWHSYTNDQLALLDHLGVDRFHVAGMCIGGPYCMGLSAAAPERVASATLMQTIGRDDNREIFFDMFDGWATRLQPLEGTSDADWQSFRENMYGGDKFLFNADDDAVRACPTPLLILEGNDPYHPRVSSQRVHELAPRSTYIEQWKTGSERDAAMTAFAEFLRAHDG